MSFARPRVALLAALAVAASILVHVPGAAAQTAPAQSQEASVHQPSIDALVKLGDQSDIDVFAGTGCADSDELCPQEPLRRWEMAVWLVRVIDRADPAAISSSVYADIDPSAWWAPHTERLVELGIVTACATDPLRFCPGAPIDRGQMAAILVRAFDIPPAERAWFVDVPTEHPHSDAIDRLAGWAVTEGCQTDPARYCPDSNVTRGQMATFLARTLRRVVLPWPRETSYEPAQDDTLLPVDPDVVIGTLDNGLTYYLRHNDRPGDRVTVRMVVNVGSVDETDAESGIGHFIEHMLFNGTADYPGNSILEALREVGVELGPDANAWVGHDETAYLAEVGTEDPANVVRVFHALSQMAGAASFEAGAVESERGVVLDEMRLALETLDGTVTREFDRIYTQGTPYESRDPIGNADTVNSFTPEMLRAFYEKWYAPANLAVVAVGDIAVEDLESLVQQYFGPLQAREGRQPPQVDIRPDPESSSHVFTDPRHAYSYISLDIPIDSHDLSTVGGDRLSTMETLIQVMIQNRLDDAYQRGELSQVDPPQFSAFSYNRGLRYYGTNWRGDNLDTASTDYLDVLLTAQEHGFTAGDLRRAVDQLLVSLEFQLNSSATILDGTWVNLYHQHFLYGADISDVETAVWRTARLAAQLTPEEITEHFRWQMERGGLLAIAVGPDPASVPTEDELDAAWAAAAPGLPPVEEVAVTKLMDAPAPVDPISEGPVEVLPGGYQWQFANGARVLFAPSNIAAGVVHMRTRSLGGWSVLEPGDRALAAIALDAIQSSGLGDLSRSQLNRFLENEAAVVNAYIGESTEGFNAGASPGDVETMFQLMHLLVTAPRVHDRAFNDAINTAEERVALAESHSSLQASVAYWEARYGDTWHRIVASGEEVASLTPERLLSLYQSRLGSVDDMVVAVVGDIAASEIESLARRYIGTLPAGESDTYVNRRRPMPSGVVQRQIALTEGESAILQIYQETDLEVTPLRAVATDVLSTALAERISLIIREELGASYTAGASVITGVTPEHVIDSTVYATVDPDRYDEVYARILEILADVAANGLTPGEFAQAVAIGASDYGVVHNGHLLEALLARARYGDDDVLTQKRRTALLEELTLEDVRAIAAALYGEGGRIEIARRP